MTASETLILIPAYKPTEALLIMLRELIPLDYSLLVVDDGGGAAFNARFDEVRALGVPVVVHEKNRGKGAALKTGIAYAAVNMPHVKYIVTADADGQHKTPDIIRVADFLVAHKGEGNDGNFVIGGRKFNGKVPLRSRFGNSVTRKVFRLATGTKVYDTQTGLRGFSIGLADYMLGIRGERYEYEINVLLYATRDKIKINNVEIETFYDADGNKGSHFSPIKDSFKVYREIFLFSYFLKFLLSTVLSFTLDVGLFHAFNKLIFSNISDLPSNAFLNFVSSEGANIFWAQMCARVPSSLFNFFFNRNFVFRSKEKLLAALGKYYILAVVIFFGQVLVMNGVIALTGWDSKSTMATVAQVIAQIVLSLLSYAVQKLLIFRKKPANKLS